MLRKAGQAVRKSFSVAQEVNPLFPWAEQGGNSQGGGFAVKTVINSDFKVLRCLVFGCSIL